MSVNTYNSSTDTLTPIAGVPVDILTSLQPRSYVGTQVAWGQMSAADKAKYDSSSGATVNFTDDDLPDDIIGDTDISDIGDGTLTGIVADLDEDITNLNSALKDSGWLETSKVNGFTVLYRKVGKQIFIRRGQVGTLSLNTEMEIATIPEGYRLNYPVTIGSTNLGESVSYNNIDYKIRIKVTANYLVPFMIVGIMD